MVCLLSAQAYRHTCAYKHVY